MNLKRESQHACVRISTLSVADFWWSECMLKSTVISQIRHEVIKWDEKVDHVDTVNLVSTWVWIALARSRWWAPPWSASPSPPPSSSWPASTSMSGYLSPKDVNVKGHLDFQWFFLSRLLRGIQKTPRSVSLTSRLGNLCRINSFTYLQVSILLHTAFLASFRERQMCNTRGSLRQYIAIHSIFFLASFRESQRCTSCRQCTMGPL